MGTMVYSSLWVMQELISFVVFPGMEGLDGPVFQKAS